MLGDRQIGPAEREKIWNRSSMLAEDLRLFDERPVISTAVAQWNAPAPP